MSGHSKWSTIKRAKGKTDVERGKLFSKLSREITTSAKTGGGDPAGNPRLRLAIDKARDANMPSDNIKRAIQKGTGAGEGIHIDEITYEGYGPGGAAFIVDVMTDNKNRTLGDLQFILSRNGGNLGKPGSVSWMFAKKGIITFALNVDEELVTSVAIDGGAEDISVGKESIDVTTSPDNFEAVRNALQAKGLKPASAEVTMVPQNSVTVNGEDARKLIKLVSLLEDHDDVQAVHANFDIPDEILAQVTA